MKIKSHEAGLQATIRTLLEQGNIVRALQLVKDPTYYWDMWNDADILMRAKDMGYNLTDKQVQEIMYNMKENFDANEGINWIVIDFHIENLMGDK